MNILEEIETAVESAWNKLKPHVVPEAEQDAKGVLDDLKTQAGQIGQQAVADAKTDAANAVVDVQKVATDALTALGLPYNDLPTEQRPTLPSDVEQGAVAGQPTVDVAPTTEAPASEPVAASSAPTAPNAQPVEESPAAASLEQASTAVTTENNPGVVPAQS